MATDAIGWLAAETTDTTGTGTYTTSDTAKDADHTTFALSLDDGDRIIYLVHSSGTLFEIVEGVWTESTKQLTRALLIYSTTGSLINWGAGTKDIYAVQPTHDTSLFALTANNLSDLADSPSARTNIGLGTAAVEAIAKFVLTDADSTIDGAASVLELTLQNDGTNVINFQLGETTGNKEYRIRRTTSDELKILHWDGSSVETELLKFTSALITAAKQIRLPSDGVDVLDAATVQQVNAAGVQYSSGDELLWIGASVPTGWTLKATEDDRMVRTETTLGDLGNTGGDWDWKESLGGDVDNHTLTLSETPAHTHDVDIKHSESGVDTGGVTKSRVATGGGTTTTFTSDSKGSGGSHKHTLTTASSWRPQWKKWGAIVKS